MPDHIFTSSSGFRQISFTVRTFSRSLRFFARICTLLFQHSHHHDCHKQHAHAPDKDIDRPDGHVDLIVHALLDGSVFQPLILLLKPFIFFSEFFQTLFLQGLHSLFGGLSHSLSLPHLLHLPYVQNTGAAFSLLEEHTWILTIVSLVVSVLLVVLLVKKVFPRPFAMAALSMVLAGAVGNLIDRALLGYVTDMFETLFMRFAVFNVADICVVVGGIAFCVYYLFFHGKEEGHGADSAAG